MRTNVQAGGQGDHLVIFYPEDRELIETAGEFLRAGLAEGGSAVIVATAARRLAFGAWFGCAGIDVAGAMANGSYLELDAAETMSRFMVNDWPDPAAFWDVISPLIQEAAEHGQPVRVFGDMVALLWESGHIGAAIDVEALWNEMACRFSFSLICGYPAQSVAGAEVSDSVTQVCQAHSAAVGALPAEAEILPG